MEMVLDTKGVPNGNSREWLTPRSLPWKRTRFLLWGEGLTAQEAFPAFSRYAMSRSDNQVLEDRPGTLRTSPL